MHQALQWSWQFGGAGIHRIFTVFCFFVAHLLDDRTASRVGLGQALEMTFQVNANLSFRLGDKAETPAIAKHAACGADCICACKPQRAEPAWYLTELSKALFTPGKMIEFFVSGTLQLCLDAVIASNEGMPLVQALCRDLAGVIDAHQPGCMRLLALAEFASVNALCRIFAGCPPGRRRDRAQRFIYAG